MNSEQSGAAFMPFMPPLIRNAVSPTRRSDAAEARMHCTSGVLGLIPAFRTREAA